MRIWFFLISDWVSFYLHFQIRQYSGYLVFTFYFYFLTAIFTRILYTGDIPIFRNFSAGWNQVKAPDQLHNIGDYLNQRSMRSVSGSMHDKADAVPHYLRRDWADFLFKNF